MNLSLIVAISENGVIGVQGDLPWRLSNDLKRFKQLTMGHHILMGRVTYDSIGRLLPGRKTVVITRNKNWQLDGARVVHGIEDAISICAEDDEPFVIGGAEIYQAALPFVNKIYLTHVHASLDGDVHFDPLANGDWVIAESTQHQADERNQFATTFTIYHRKDAH